MLAGMTIGHPLVTSPRSAGPVEPVGTVWLSPQERAAWLGLNGIMLKLPGLLDGQLERDAQLTFFEYMVLAMLAEADPPRLRMSRLAVLTSGSLSRLSHVAKRLEGKGFIVRETDPHDRRSTNAILTDTGRAKVEASAPGHVEAVRRLVFDNLDEKQVGQLADIGAAVLSRIDHDGATRPAGDED